MEENSGKERMKILTNITNTTGDEDREQDEYQFNTDSCSEETEVRSSSASKRNHSVEFIKIFKLFLPVHKKNQKSCAQVQIDLQRVVHHGRG